MNTSCALHPGLAAAFEFEEQRVGLPVEVHRRHLLDLPRRSSLRPVIDVNVHTAATNENFPVRFDDEILDINAPAYVVDDQEIFGYRDNSGDVAALAGVSGNRVNVYFDLDLVFRMPERVRFRTTAPPGLTRATASTAAFITTPVTRIQYSTCPRCRRPWTTRSKRSACALGSPWTQ